MKCPTSIDGEGALASRSMSGVVLAEGEPVSAAFVAISNVIGDEKGTYNVFLSENRTRTDANGRYSVKILDLGDIIGSASKGKAKAGVTRRLPGAELDFDLE